MSEWKEAEAQTGSFQLYNTTHLTSSIVRKTQSNLIELIMAETLTQQASRSSKCAKKFLVLQAFFCIAASAIGHLIIFTFLCPGCSSVTSSPVVYTYWAATVFLFLLGVMTLALLVYYKRRQHSTTYRVAISLIPTEDLEKTPVPILHYNHVSQRQQLAQMPRPHQHIRHRWICPIIFQLSVKILMKFIHL